MITPGCDKFLYTCNYVLPVSVLLQSIQMNLYSVKNKLKLLVIASLQHFLYNVVCELILHHDLTRRVIEGIKERLAFTTTKQVINNQIAKQVNPSDNKQNVRVYQMTKETKTNYFLITRSNTLQKG